MTAPPLDFNHSNVILQSESVRASVVKLVDIVPGHSLSPWRFPRRSKGTKYTLVIHPEMMRSVSHKASETYRFRPFQEETRVVSGDDPPLSEGADIPLRRQNSIHHAQQARIMTVYCVDLIVKGN